MAVKYVIVEKVNPLDKTQPRKFYAQSKSSGIVTLKSLSREIAECSTMMSDADVLAVLNDFTKLICRHLADGKIVKFGNFGNFKVSIGSRGAESKDKFNVSLIKNCKILYCPGADMKEILTNMKYEK